MRAAGCCRFEGGGLVWLLGEPLGTTGSPFAGVIKWRNTSFPSWTAPGIYLFFLSFFCFRFSFGLSLAFSALPSCLYLSSPYHPYPFLLARTDISQTASARQRHRASSSQLYQTLPTPPPQGASNCIFQFAPNARRAATAGELEYVIALPPGLVNLSVEF